MKYLVSALAAALLLPAASVQAATLLADVEIAYFNSGANLAFPTGIYGGNFAGPPGFPVALADTSFARDGNADTFVSLPTGSYLTLGFSGGFVFDGVGNDIFVSEVGGASETADIFISSDFGLSFTFLGTATTSTVSGFDLASIGYTGQVNAVKVVGLDNFGASPGFDLAFVQGLEGSVVIQEPAPVPLPAAAPLLLAGLGALAGLRRLRRR
ncbi:VPLPA-CTERM sorting domain-containing protein [Frigidibacter sp. MR17.14]|uniref:VPLPA-CTERM sorting domain-containing protein n=1 Tax=Frigidibacter sp. MR17.14 TaxID=3126509 RepID=UPI003012C223